MHKKLNRFLSMLLALVMILSCIPAMALASETEETPSALAFEDADFKNVSYWGGNNNEDQKMSFDEDGNITMMLNGNKKANMLAVFKQDGSLQWSNYKFSASVESTPDSENTAYVDLGILINYDSNAKNGYELWITPTGDKTYEVMLGRRDANALTKVVEAATFTATEGNGYDLANGATVTFDFAVQVVDGVLTLYINGETSSALSIAATEYTQGSVGFKLLRKTSAKKPGYTVVCKDLAVEAVVDPLKNPANWKSDNGVEGKGDFEVKDNGDIEFYLHGDQKANVIAAYNGEEMLSRSDYKFSAKVESYPNEAKTMYGDVGLRINFDWENKNGYEVWVFPAGDKEYKVMLGRRDGNSLTRLKEDVTFKSAKGNGYDLANGGKIEFEIAVQVLDGVLHVLINGETSGALSIPATEYTQGSVGLLLIRRASKAGKQPGYKVTFKDLKVEDAKEIIAGGTVISGMDFYASSNWSLPNSGGKTSYVDENSVFMGLEASKAANISLNFNTTEASELQNYAFSADVVQSKGADGLYGTMSSRIYIQPGGPTQGGCYEVWVNVVSDHVISASLYLREGGQKLLLAGGSVAVSESLGFGNDTVAFNLKLQNLNGVVSCIINGKTAFNHEDSTYTKGNFGFCLLRPQSPDSNYYEARMTNLKIETAAPAPDIYQVEMDITGVDQTYTNDENYIIVGYDDFSNYALGELGSWHSKLNDTNDGDWRINNGFLVNGCDDDTTTTIALYDGKSYAVGSVEADIMLATELTCNVYAGVVLGYNGSKNYYGLRIEDKADGSHWIRLQHYFGGGRTNVAEFCLDDVGVEIERFKWYHVKLALVGDMLLGFIDGKLYIEYDTTQLAQPYTFGVAGVRGTQGTCLVDNFVFTVPRQDYIIKDSFDSLTSWAAGSDFAVSNGALVLNANASGPQTILNTSSKTVGFGAVAMDVLFNSGVTADAFAGPVVGSANGTDYRLVLVDSASGADKLALYKGTDLLASVDVADLAKDKIYNVEIFQYNDKIYGYLDGVMTLIHETTDDLSKVKGQTGIYASAGVTVDNFAVCGETQEFDSNEVPVVNDTVVEKPDVFTDNFNDEKVGEEEPNFWLENNEKENWQIHDLNGEKVYGVSKPGVEGASWLHVFETNVDMSTKIYVSSQGTADNAKVGLITRLTGTNADVRILYDFAKQKWYIADCKGINFIGTSQLIYAPETSEFALDTWHTLRVRAVDAMVEVWFDGKLVLTTDRVRQVTTGRAAVYTKNAVMYVDDVELQLLSGQGRVEEAVLDQSKPIDYFSDGGSVFWYSDEVAILNYKGAIFISYDQGATFKEATAEENETYKFFRQSSFTQYIRLHNGWILKIGNSTQGNVWLSKDNGATSETLPSIWSHAENWSVSSITASTMNDMLKEVNLGDIDGDGKDNYRVFLCADIDTPGKTHHWEEVWYTDDCGYTWHMAKMPTSWVSGMEHLCEARIYPASDGSLRMLCTWNYTDSARILVSRDHGLTWGEEHALPLLSCSRSSFDFDIDEDGTIYLAFCYGDPNAPGGSMQYGRQRFVLIRSTDGINWEFMLDLWRWDDVPNDGLAMINQIVNPSVQIGGDYIFVAAGWSEQRDSASVHNAQRQIVIKLDKNKLTPYEQWPDDYTAPKDIVSIKVTAPSKLTYKVGEELDLTGGYLTVHYYDGTTEKVPLTDAGVDISAPNYADSYSYVFPKPDMNVVGSKFLRVTYKTFADSFTIVVEEGELEHVHDLEHHDEVCNGCAKEGMKEYWYCKSCDTYYEDAECTKITNRLSLVISHSVDAVKEVWNGCTKGGMKAHWYCNTCDVYYEDAACTKVTNAKNLVIPAHNVKHVEEVKATATENGMMEHWYCEECDVYYGDAECTIVTNAKNLTIEATGNPQAGDNSSVFMMVAIAIVAATSVTALVITKKRFF